MWYEFNRRCPYYRAARTRYEELLEMGIPEDEIVFVRVDGKDDLLEKWDSWTKYDSVQCIELFSHGTDGNAEVYKGSGEIFIEGKLNKNINWAPGPGAYEPQLIFHGCYIARNVDFTQRVANHYGVPVVGSKLGTSFSNDLYKHDKIVPWGLDNPVYMGTYGTYDDGTFLFNESKASLFYQRIVGNIFGRYICPDTIVYLDSKE